MFGVKVDTSRTVNSTHSPHTAPASESKGRFSFLSGLFSLFAALARFFSSLGQSATMEDLSGKGVSKTPAPSASKVNTFVVGDRAPAAMPRDRQQANRAQPVAQRAPAVSDENSQPNLGSPERARAHQVLKDVKAIIQKGEMSLEETGKGFQMLKELKKLNIEIKSKPLKQQIIRIEADLNKANAEIIVKDAEKVLEFLIANADTLSLKDISHALTVIRELQSLDFITDPGLKGRLMKVKSMLLDKSREPAIAAANSLIPKIIEVINGKFDKKDKILFLRDAEKLNNLMKVNYNYQHLDRFVIQLQQIVKK